MHAWQGTTDMEVDAMYRCPTRLQSDHYCLPFNRLHVRACWESTGVVPSVLHIANGGDPRKDTQATVPPLGAINT